MVARINYSTDFTVGISDYHPPTAPFHISGSLYCMTMAFQTFGSIFSTLLFNMVYHPETGNDQLSYSLPFWIMGSFWLAIVPLSL